MHKALITITGLLCIILAGYVVSALSWGASTNVLVKLAGPGATPSTCFKRLKPDFEVMEDTMTKLANAVIASETIDSLFYGIDRNGDPFLSVDTGTKPREPTPDEMTTFVPLFHSAELENYYGPFGFKKNDRQVYAFTGAVCGASFFEWIKFRMGDSEPFEGPITFGAGFTYWSDGVPELEECSAPVNLVPGRPAICEVRINEYWSWHSEWLSEPL